MKSSSDVRPAIILPLGNGSYHYNYNIVEEKVEDPETGEKTVYNYDTCRFGRSRTTKTLRVRLSVAK